MGWVMSEGDTEDTSQRVAQRWSHDPRVRQVTVVGHGEDGDLSNGAIPSLNPAGPLVDGSQVCVHVAGEAAPAWHLLSGRGHLRGERRPLYV